MIKETCEKCNANIEGEIVNTYFDDEFGIELNDIQFDCVCGHSWQSQESTELINKVCYKEWEDDEGEWERSHRD